VIKFIQRGYIVRHWPFMVAFVAWLLLLLPTFFQSEIIRAVVALICMALMVVQWLIHRKATSGADFAFLSLVVAGFSLINLWLALNVVRFYTYDADSGRGVHMTIIRIQDSLVWTIGVLIAVISVWALFAIVRWLGKRMATVRLTRL
jgi:hypothetical protein